MKIKYFLLAVFFVFCFMSGCNFRDKNSDNEPKETLTETGTAEKLADFDFVFRYKNYSEDKVFKSCSVWAEYENGRKKNLVTDTASFIDGLFQADFDGDGKCELIVVIRPIKDKNTYNFTVYTINDDFSAEKVFENHGSVSFCDFWMTDGKTLIHANSLRNYEKPENAVYKSRYEADFYSAKKTDGKIVFSKYKSLTTKRELDSLDDIKNALGISPDALNIYNGDKIW